MQKNSGTDRKMLRSCKYCGRIHDSKFDCGKKPKRNKPVTYIDKFRWSELWKRKRTEIKERDEYLCQACIRNLPGTIRKYVHENIQVHHNIPINVNYDLRLENSNLIALCPMHHEMAENGEISRETIQKIIEEQEKKQTA